MNPVSRESLNATFEKYRKNKTQIAPEDLAGKYKTAFDRLKEQLSEELHDYFIPLFLRDMPILNDEEGEAVCQRLNDYLVGTDYGHRCAKAVFENLDLDEAVRITEEARSQAYTEIYGPYFARHKDLLEGKKEENEEP